MKRSALQRRTPLARGQPLTRSGQLAPISEKGKATKAKLRAAYDVVDATQDHWYAACGCSSQLERSHALTQKKWDAHRDNPANLVILCHADHALWEHNKRAFAGLYPDVWARKVAIIRRLEPRQYALMQIKYPDLLPDE